MQDIIFQYVEPRNLYPHTKLMFIVWIHEKHFKHPKLATENHGNVLHPQPHVLGSVPHENMDSLWVGANFSCLRRAQNDTRLIA